MSLHLIKLCVGCDSIEDLADWQAERLKAAPQGRREEAAALPPHLPDAQAHAPSCIDGGSLYWVIKGLVQVRQPLARHRRGHQGGRHALLPADPEERADPRAARRRGAPSRAGAISTPTRRPTDLKRGAAGDIVAMPPKLRKQLAELGLL